MLYYLPLLGAHCSSFQQTRLFCKAPTGSSHQNLFLGHLLTPTQRSGGSKSALLSTPFYGPTISVCSKQGFFGEPRTVGLTRTLF